MKRLTLLLAIPWACLPLLASAQDYLGELPEPDRLLTDMAVDNELETVARRFAAFDLISDVIGEFGRESSGKMDRTGWRPAEGDAFMRYRAADTEYRASVDPKYDAPCDQSVIGKLLMEYRCDRYKLVSRRAGYRRSPEFQREVLERYLSAASIERYFSLKRAADERYEASRAPAREAATPARAPAAVSPIWSLLSLSFWQPITLGVYLLGVVGVFRSWRPVRLGDADLFDLTGTSKRLEAITGHVYGVGAHSVVTTEVTSTTTHDRYGAQTSHDVSTKADVHRQFFIAPSDGAHVPMEFVNWNPHLTEGHLVSCVWWRGKRDRSVETGSHVLMVLNHTTGLRYANDKNIDAVVKPSLLPAFCFAGPVLYLAFAVGMNDDALWGVVATAAGIFVGYWMVRGIANLFRARRFWNRDCERVRDHLSASVKQDERIVLGPGIGVELA